MSEPKNFSSIYFLIFCSYQNTQTHHNGNKSRFLLFYFITFLNMCVWVLSHIPLYTVLTVIICLSSLCTRFLLLLHCLAWTCIAGFWALPDWVKQGSANKNKTWPCSLDEETHWFSCLRINSSAWSNANSGLEGESSDLKGNIFDAPTWPWPQQALTKLLASV